MIKFEEQFPEAIDLLARALRAGHALTTGLSMVADEMAGAGRAGVPAAVTISRTSACRCRDALKAFARRACRSSTRDSS